MRYIKDTLWNIVQEYLFRPMTLTRIVNALLPLLHEKVIRYLDRGFDIHIRDMLRPKVGPKEEYIVYECTRPATLWFLIDLSKAQGGDLFEIKVYIRLTSGEFLLRDHYELDGPRELPIATLSSCFAPSCRLTITQTGGSSREVGYEVFGRYEGR